MGRKVSVDDLGNAVMRELTEYCDMADREVKKTVEEVGNHVKEEIMAKAPVRTGKYRKSWTVTKQSETKESLVVTVHSRTRYRLTHLLEKGHVKRGGGRVKAIPHIAPAEAAAEKELLEAVEKKLKGG